MPSWSCASVLAAVQHNRIVWPKLSSFLQAISRRKKKNKKKNQNLIFLSLHQLSSSPVISLSFSQNNCSRPLQTRAHQWAHSISYPSLHQHPIRSLPPAPHWPESPLMHTWWGTALICNSTDSFENWKLLGKKHTLRAVPRCGHWNPTWHSTAGL